MPRLVENETDHGSGPVEEALLASLRPYSETILRPALLPQDCVDFSQLGRLLFVHLAHVLGFLVLGRAFNTGDVGPSFSPFVVEDRLNLPGKLDGVLRLGRSFF